MAKTNKFTFTNFNLNSEVVYETHDDTIRFMAYGLETCPTTGRQHHQGYLVFQNKRSCSANNLNKIGELFKINETDVHVHVEPMYGSLKSNERYCSKQSSLIQMGDPPQQGARNDLIALKAQILNGKSVDDIIMEEPEMYHQYGRTLDKIEDIVLRRKWRTEMTQCDWIYGPTGVGKSHAAFDQYDPSTHYVKNLNEDWWDGYKGQPIVILNEFRGQIKFSEMLDLVDKWPKTVKRRNREPAPFLAQKIIVTSSKPPDEIFINCLDNYDQLERRINLINLGGPGPDVLTR